MKHSGPTFHEVAHGHGFVTSQDVQDHPWVARMIQAHPERWVRKFLPNDGYVSREPMFLYDP